MKWLRAKAMRGSGWRGIALLAALIAGLLWTPGADCALATAGIPRSPCRGPVMPPYAAPGQPANVAMWHEDELARAGWRPPACLPWQGETKMVLAVAGSFRSDETADRLLRRLGTISDYPSILYWSGRARRWKPIADQAWAVGPDNGHRRADFTAAEIRAGLPLYYAEDGSKTGTVLYRMRTVSYDPNHIIVAIENVSKIRLLFLTLFEPGALQTALFFDRVGPHIWGLYLLTRTTEGTSMLAGGHEESYINRDEGIFDFFAGRGVPGSPALSR